MNRTHLSLNADYCDEANKVKHQKEEARQRTRVRKRDAVRLRLLLPPPIQRPLKTGLPHEYKITRERGDLKPYASEILHDVFRIALILLPKRSK